MEWIVLKFGGSSLCERGYNVILEQINNLQNNKHFEVCGLECSCKIIIVLSAIQKTTNKLVRLSDGENIFEEIKQDHINICKQLEIPFDTINKLFTELEMEYNFILKKLDNAYLSKINIISYGEIISTHILSLLLKKHNIAHNLINSQEIIFSENNHTAIDKNNLILKGKFCCNKQRLCNQIKTNVAITQGFICSTKDNYTCLLSRGGSDTTASILATTMQAKKLEIWTDVDGIYSADPNNVENAQIIPNINYDICQELSAMGAKVLHPYCVKPCQEMNIPIYIKNTFNSNSKLHTIINSDICNISDKIFCVTNQKNITVFCIKSLNMWNDYGFVSDIFNIFSCLGIDINIIITSQFSISCTTNESSLEKINSAKETLCKKYEIKLYINCNIISLVGNNIIQNKKIHESHELINKIPKDNIYIIHYSDNNLSLSYVVNNSISDKLVSMFHTKFICNIKLSIPKQNITSCWYNKKDKITEAMNNNSSLYIYDMESIKQKCKSMKSMTNIKKIYYAMKANYNIPVLKTICREGIGIECVSIEEIRYIRKNISDDCDIIFTPNYCNKDEYRIAFDYNAIVVIDNYEILLDAINIFRNKDIGLRIDCDLGDGHHEKVITEGSNVKFGFLPTKENLDILLSITKRHNIKIIGLHSHKGSGILDNNAWKKTMDKLLSFRNQFNDIKWINLGGGFGIKQNEKELDLNIINNTLNTGYDIDIYIEPGRYLVSESGVLVSKVTQIRKKNDINFIGLSTGMNSLIRPTLYGAYHNILNLSKIDHDSDTKYTIVGPICESGDVMGEDRLLPETEVDDLILIENAGAYGYSMSSRYNLREPAAEYVIS